MGFESAVLSVEHHRARTDVAIRLSRVQSVQGGHSCTFANPACDFIVCRPRLFIQGGLAISAMLLLLHVISMIVSVLMILVENKKLRNLLHVLLNILAPNINAQAIIVDVLTKRSPLCKQLYNLANPENPGSLGIVALENVDVAWNWVILILHVVFYLLLLIAIDGGLLKCSCSCAAESDFDDTKIDDDVLKERERILQLHRVPSNENALETDENDAEQETDHLIVHDLVRRFPGRPTPAVNHLTFGAKRGEAFGLLGYNVSHPSPSRYSPHSTARRERAKQPHSRFSSVTKHPPRAPPSSTDKTSTIACDPFVVSATVHSKIAAWNS